MFLRALVAASFIMIAGPAVPQATPETILGLSGPQVCPAVPLTTGWGDNCVPTLAMLDQLFAAKADVGVAPNLPSSAGSGGLYVCVDSSGTLYKKASCP